MDVTQGTLKVRISGEEKEKILHISRSKFQSLAHTHWQTELSRLTLLHDCKQ